LASQGCPIVGDLKYGAATPLPDKSIGLHAYRLQFEHPVQKTPIQITASIPTNAPWSFFKQMVAELA
jgi:23S rRNA pseudouridine1911/1915/1917 synthase